MGSGAIDVVITWVDGDDPGWRRSFEAWDRRIPDAAGPDGRHPARYRDHGELRFALRSVAAMAPWVRRIHLVTAGQRPPWLRPDSRLRLVSHEDIFDPAMLPTFNSHAIEARLHHVPGLAERFLYLNDDVFLTRPQRPDAYFGADGRWRVTLGDLPLPDATTSTGASIDLSALATLPLLRDAGVTLPARRPDHGPFALRRSHLAWLERAFAGPIEATAAHRFRSPDDISVPTFLAPLHALATGRATPSDLRVGYVGVDDVDLAARLAELRDGGDHDAWCLNHTERVPDHDRHRYEVVRRALQSRLPEPTPWEADATGTGRIGGHVAG